MILCYLHLVIICLSFCFLPENMIHEDVDCGPLFKQKDVLCAYVSAHYNSDIDHAGGLFRISDS